MKPFTATVDDWGAGMIHLGIDRDTFEEYPEIGQRVTVSPRADTRHRRATDALTALRTALEDIKLPSPLDRVDRTAADACAQMLRHMDHVLNLLEVYIGPEPPCTCRPPEPDPACPAHA